MFNLIPEFVVNAVFYRESNNSTFTLQVQKEKQTSMLSGKSFIQPEKFNFDKDNYIFLLIESKDKDNIASGDRLIKLGSVDYSSNPYFVEMINEDAAFDTFFDLYWVVCKNSKGSVARK